MIEKYILWMAVCVWIVSNTDLSNCKMKTIHSGVLSGYRDSISNIEAGRLKLASTSLGRKGRYIPYNITFSTVIASNYDLTTSIQNIYSFIPSALGLDFQITGVKRPTLFTGIFVIDSDAKWGWVQLSYLVTSRGDFIAGNLILSNNKLIAEGSNNTQISFQMHVPSKSQINTAYAYSVPFISGMRTYDQSLNLSFTDCQYLLNNSQLNVTLLTRYAKYPLESLSISYIIFNMASELQITSVYNISFVPININTYLGLSSVQSNSNLFKNAINNTNLPHFGLQSSPTQIQIFSEIFGIDGVIIQTQQSIDLLYLAMAQASSTTLYCISKSSCQSFGGYMVYTQTSVFEITSRCQVCGKFMTFNNSSGECVCMTGFIFQNGSCVNRSSFCPSNSSFNNVKQICQCFQLFVNVSGVCRPIVQLCKTNEVYVAGKCIAVTFSPRAPSCPLNYLLVNSTCLPPTNCLPPQKLNTSTNQCQCPNQMQLVNGKCLNCSQNQTFVNKKCTCKPMFFRINDKCLKCHLKAYFDGKTCVCMKTFNGNGFNCTPQPIKKTATPGTIAAVNPKSPGVNKIQGNN